MSRVFWKSAISFGGHTGKDVHGHRDQDHKFSPAQQKVSLSSSPFKILTTY